MRLWKLFLILPTSLMFVACGITHLGEPLPDPWDYWDKLGLNIEQRRQAYYQCGFSGQTRSMDEWAKLDECMLKNGFTFVDSSWAPHCRDNDPRPEIHALPSCKSLTK